VKEKEEVSLLTHSGEQVEPAKVMEALLCPRLGDSDLENPQNAPDTLGPEFSASW